MARWKRTRIAAPQQPGVTEHVPGYRDLHRIGHGGFSVVYRAHQEEIGRTVALKVLAVEFVDGRILRQFLREVQLTARLTGHPNVVTVLDSGMTTSGRPYIAMDFYDRGSLRDRLLSDGPLPVREVLRVGVKIAGALEAAHREGMLHRDVKPQNILLSRYGEPALGDFGTARLTAALDASSRTEALTPVHAAPEVLRGEPATERCDVYSLGSTLYQLLEGRPAFQRDSDTGITQLLLRVLTEPPALPTRADAPPLLTAAILKAMDRQPSQRYASAAEMAVALQEVQAALGFPVTEIAEHIGGSRPPDGESPGAAVTTSPWAPRSESAITPTRRPEPRSQPATADGASAPVPAATADPAPDSGPAVSIGTAPDPDQPDQCEIALAATPWSGSETVTGWKPPAPSGSGPDTPPVAADAPRPTAFDQPIVAGAGRRTKRSERGRKALPTLFALAGAVVMAGFVTALVITSTAPKDSPAAPPSPLTRATSPSPSAPATVDAAPSGLTAQSVGGSVTLTWTLPSDDNHPLVLVQSPATSTLPTYLDIGTTHYSIGGLDPARTYCFKVGAVTAVGAGVSFQWAEPVCAKG